MDAVSTAEGKFPQVTAGKFYLPNFDVGRISSDFGVALNVILVAREFVDRGN